MLQLLLCYHALYFVLFIFFYVCHRTAKEPKARVGVSKAG